MLLVLSHLSLLFVLIDSEESCHRFTNLNISGSEPPESLRWLANEELGTLNSDKMPHSLLKIR